MAENTIDPLKHALVPKHEILKEEELKKALSKFNVSKKQLPKILSTDIVVKNLKAKPGDVLKITRKSETADESEFYRVVINAK